MHGEGEVESADSVVDHLHAVGLRAAQQPLGDLDRLLQLRMRVELRNLQRHITVE